VLVFIIDTAGIEEVAEGGLRNHEFICVQRRGEKQLADGRRRGRRKRRKGLEGEKLIGIKNRQLGK
jgi:hypothetical protein